MFSLSPISPGRILRPPGIGNRNRPISRELWSSRNLLSLRCWRRILHRRRPANRNRHRSCPILMRHHNRPVILRTRIAAITSPFLDLLFRSTPTAAHDDESKNEETNNNSNDSPDLSAVKTIATVLRRDSDGTVRGCSRNHA